MPTVRFLGRVYPEAVMISLKDIPQVAWEAGPSGIEVVSIRISSSVVEVACEVERYQSDDFSRLYLRAYNLVRAALDTIAFARGVALDVVFEAAIDATGAVGPIAHGKPYLSDLCTAYKIEPTTAEETQELHGILHMVMFDPALSKALNDLIQSLTVPNNPFMNCGRVLDGLRMTMTSPGTHRKIGWRLLQENLNADQNYLNMISQASTGPRHADHTEIPPVIALEVQKRTWIIMNRALEFRKRGSQPLPIEEFPLLIG